MSFWMSFRMMKPLPFLRLEASKHGSAAVDGRLCMFADGFTLNVVVTCGLAVMGVPTAAGANRVRRSIMRTRQGKPHPQLAFMTAPTRRHNDDPHRWGWKNYLGSSARRGGVPPTPPQCVLCRLGQGNLSASLSLPSCRKFNLEANSDDKLSASRTGRPNMLNVRLLSTLAVLIPVLGAATAAEAAKKDVNAIRAECFRQANEAASAAARNMSTGATAARNSAGTSAYRECARRNGIRP
jgi:hypothetical protein